MRTPQAEALEGRRLLSGSTALPDVRIVAATTHDSRSVSFTYDVVNAPLSAPVTIGVYRSAEPAFGPDAIPVGSWRIDPGAVTLDQAGQPAGAEGTHPMTLALAGGLAPNPDHPYVLVVADPTHQLAGSSAANPADHTAEFRTHVIGVVTHGGVQPKEWKHGPLWERQMAAGLRQQGYDAVIPFNWVAQSNHPGAAAQVAPRLAHEVAAAASRFPADEPVDVHFIGHSEGAVVNSLAIVRLQTEAPLQEQAGYVEETMLDPHGATNAFPGPQYSIAPGIVGALAKSAITQFQGRANDPVPFVPRSVDSAQVFFQHTPVSEAQSKFAWQGTIPRAPIASPENVWGQVPVVGQASYFDLTGPGISHAGHFSVPDWYRLNIVPTLGEGAPVVAANALTVQPSFAWKGSRAASVRVSTTDQPIYTGTAAPGAAVRLLAAPHGSNQLDPIGQTVATPEGTWSLTTRPLPAGLYRVVAVADVSPSSGDRPLHMRPTAWSSPLVIEPGRSVT